MRRQRNCQVAFWAEDSAAGSTLLFRSVVVHAEPDCSAPLLNVPSKTCADASYSDTNGRDVGVCATLARCTDSTPVAGHALLNSIDCVCESPYYAPSPMAPYEEDGCRLRKRVRGITSITSGISTSLTKPHHSAATLNLTVHMEGNDQEPTRWNVTNAEALPAWLKLPVRTAPIAPAAEEVTFSVELSAAGLRERATPYVDALQVRVESDSVNDTHTVPVRLSVASRTDAVVWGRVGADERCSSANVTEASVVVGVESAVRFTACDAEGLPVAHSLPSATDPRSFTASLNGTDSPLTYLGNGVYEIVVQATLHGADALQLKLGGNVVAPPLNLMAACPSTRKVALPTGRLAFCTTPRHEDSVSRRCPFH